MSRIANFLLNAEWDRSLGFSILLLGFLYAHGLMALWQRAGIGHGISKTQASFFGAGVVLLALALASPLHPLGEMLFSAHMLQHLLLIVVATPLLLSGLPGVALAWALPSATRRPLAHWWHRQIRRHRRGWQALKGWWSHPSGVGIVFAGTLWLWHVPRFYETALQDERWHMLEHSALLIAALLFWWVALPTAQINRQRRGPTILLLLITTMHSGVLGALITFSPTPWYDSYQYTTVVWAITPLADQQLAGVLMWWPMGLVLGGAMMLHLAVWLREPGYRMQHSAKNRMLDSTMPVASSTEKV